MMGLIVDPHSAPNRWISVECTNAIKGEVEICQVSALDWTFDLPP